MMSSNVSDEQFRLLCLLHLTEEAMRELLGHFMKNQTLSQKKKTSITTNPHDAGAALADVLNFIPATKLSDIETHFHRTSSKIYNAIFTTNPSAKSKRLFSVNPTIDIKTFDISALNYLLTGVDLDFLPTRKAMFRKKDGRLSCNEPSHLKKCCLNCVTANGKLHGNDSSPCSICSTSQYECYNEHTPCCALCMTCDACAGLSHSTCPNGQVRHAINFLHNVRNLNAHSNIQTYNDLQAGTFADENFPCCKAWNTLWNSSSNHLVNLFTFLETNAIIDRTIYIAKCDEVKNKLPLKTKAELSETFSEVLLNLCDEFRRMLIESEQNVSKLTATISSLTESVSEVSEVRQTVSDLKKNILGLTPSSPESKSCKIKFLLSADDDGCWKMINDFLGLKQTLRKEDLTLRSELSRQLTTYVETVLASFVSNVGSLSVLLEKIKYDNIEAGYLYQFVVAPKVGNVNPKNWLNEIQNDAALLKDELERCIKNAIRAEKNVEPDIHMYHITFGSLVFTVLISEASESTDLNSVIEGCVSQFSDTYFQLTSCKRLDNSAHLAVSCDMIVSLSGDVSLDISYLENQIRGPVGVKSMETRYTQPETNQSCTHETKPKKNRKLKSNKLQSPEDFLMRLSKSDLNGKNLLTVLQALAVNLRTLPLSWVQDFGARGLEEILKKLRLYVTSTLPDEQKIQHECVKCIKAFMNNKFGLQLMLTNTSGLTLLVQTITSKSWRNKEGQAVMTDVVKIMGALTLLAHEMALEAITKKTEVDPDCPGRFHYIVSALKDKDVPTSLKVACLQLVNALVSRPVDLHFRLHLRNEVIREGLSEDALFDLLSHDDDELNIQVQVFNDSQNDDEDQFRQRFDNIEAHMRDTRQLFDIINTSALDTDCEPFLLSILQHLLMIRDDQVPKVNYYRLIEQCVSQIVLQRGGIDPDFGAKKLDIDVECILEYIITSMKSSQQFNVLQEAEDKLVEYEQKLQTEIAMRTEAEVKLEMSEEIVQQKIKSLEDKAEKENVLEEEIKEMNDEQSTAPAVVTSSVENAASSVSALALASSAENAAEPSTAVPLSFPYEDTFWAGFAEDNYKQDYLSSIMKSFAVKVSNDEVKLESGGARKDLKLKILDANCARKISIFLEELKLPFEEFKMKFLELDEEVLTITALEGLKAIPDKDVLDKFKDIPKEYMVPAERFVAVIHDIPRFKERRECMKIKLEFNLESQDVKNNIAMVTEAFKEIRRSRKWALLLELILLTGNFINTGNKRIEKAHGFNLEILLKLKDTKTLDGKNSLGHFIAEWVTETYTDIIGWTRELSHVKDALKVCTNPDATSVVPLVEQVEKCRKELEAIDHKKPFSDSDKFTEKMKKFVAEGIECVKVIEAMHENMTTSFTDLLDFYTIDYEKTPEEILKVISQFIVDYEQFEKDNIKRKEDEDRKAYTKQKKESKEVDGSSMALKSETGVLDGLMEALADGDTFRDQRKGPSNLQQDQLFQSFLHKGSFVIF